ncbi:MAG: 4'-phosphopantetheinyl transferase superfamily protein [Chloroflexales bacterium]|nr:4'-phosphopantetheinyl transferase superfamily protein [Chloroflexales bacterium]
MLYTGIDIIEISRIQHAVERWNERFLHRVFTHGELLDSGFAQSEHRNYASLAARWAAKEAAAKMLGVGLRGLGGSKAEGEDWNWAGNEAAKTFLKQPKLASVAKTGVGWTEIEVARGVLGRPFLRLYGAAEQAAMVLSLRECAVSLSHSRDYAVASVVGIGVVPGS